MTCAADHSMAEAAVLCDRAFDLVNEKRIHGDCRLIQQRVAIAPLIRRLSDFLRLSNEIVDGVSSNVV